MATIPTAASVEETVRLTRHDKEGRPFSLLTNDLGPHRVALQLFYESFEPKRGAQGLPPVDSERIAAWLGGVLSAGIHLLAFRGDRLIGHCLVMPTARAGVGEYAVFLSQDERGRGVGTELNRAAAAAARAAGLKALWLSVEPRNRAAIRSYEKAGFRFVPETIFSIEPEMELAL